jgi:hypothetical protein
MDDAMALTPRRLRAQRPSRLPIIVLFPVFSPRRGGRAEGAVRFSLSALKITGEWSNCSLTSCARTVRKITLIAFLQRLTFAAAAATPTFTGGGGG